MGLFNRLFGCSSCAARDQQIADLRQRLDAATQRGDRAMDRVMALVDPQSLAILRAHDRGARPTAAFAHDAETRTTTMLVDGIEMPIEIVAGKPYVNVNGARIPADDPEETQKWVNWLAGGGMGNSPGMKDHGLPPLPGERPHG